jgi:hypothetical protein
MKTEKGFKGMHYVFGRDQVLAADLDEFLGFYDPRRFSPVEMRRLFGRLSIELEDAILCGDLATIPEARTLIRKLHAAWPWAGFFLDFTRPLGSAETLGALPVVAYALCVVDMELVAWEGSGKCAVDLNEDQMRRFRTECFNAIDLLGKRAGLPPEVLAGRKDAVAKQLNRLLEAP